MSILLAGFSGLAGSAIYDRLNKSFGNVVGINTKILDLTDRKMTFEFVNDLKPEIVIDAAAFAGGIARNNSLPVDFISKNLQIQTNLMDASHSANVRKFIFLGSSCIYPKHCPQPIREEYLLTGILEDTNSAYAVAKISGLELIKAYRKQFGRKWISLMPTNLYGPFDNFNIESGHVLPALINKMVSAVQNYQNAVTLWGTGMAKREFLHTRDLATAVELALEKYDSDLHLNVGTSKDLTIKELAEMIARLTGYSGEILWDTTKPDGTPRKILDSSRLEALGWQPKIDLEEGIKDTIAWFISNYQNEK